jgi:hypothetical protein
LTIDGKGLVSTGATVAAGGSGYAVGDVLHDPYGGMYTVATLSGTAVATVTAYTDALGILHEANYPSATAPANPVATTVWDWAAGIATGCTLNLAWSASGGDLTLQASGGRTLFGGATAPTLEVKPLGGAFFIQSDGGNLTLDGQSSINLGWSLATNIYMNVATQFQAHVGFNGTVPIAKPTVTGAKGSNAALASLMTALAAYGLVTDSTSA